MKTITVLFILSVSINFNYAQTTTSYDKAMISLAKEVASRVKEKNKTRVAIWGFTNTFGKESALGEYIGRDFSIHFTNASKGIGVIDRDHLAQLLKEHELNEQGFIDPATAKQLGMIIAADAIITGTVDVGLHHLRIRIKIINTETGLQIAAALKNVPIDENTKVILDETGEMKSKNIDKGKKRINKSENYNDPKSTNPNCENLNTGDYCFKNMTSNSYEIKIYGKKRGHFYGIMQTKNVSAHQDVCFVDLPAGSFSYVMVKNNQYLREIKGGFRVEKCKSLTYTIK